ncbi:hypothetical protein Aca07nite_19170 [Actinoplanes capillaceus]|uniref:Uncharacterized protein n=1 Tax=Actinoplanes campanulatus TaxID=113559 RepID=A0ABQ3WEW8_9ACTN|nr:hypothetical protein Aca07nite_19170 [Actinoplanes capillaceus]
MREQQSLIDWMVRVDPPPAGPARGLGRVPAGLDSWNLALGAAGLSKRTVTMYIRVSALLGGRLGGSWHSRDHASTPMGGRGFAVSRESCERVRCH